MTSTPRTTDEPCGLNSPLLRAVQERNEAREMVKRLLYSVALSNDSIERDDALLEAFRATRQWKDAGHVG
jgi:hypothetical protein